MAGGPPHGWQGAQLFAHGFHTYMQESKVLIQAWSVLDMVLRKRT